MSASMHQVIQMNNTGACQINKRKYLSAIETLTKALKKTKDLISLEFGLENEGSRSSDSFSCNFCRSGFSSFTTAEECESTLDRCIFKEPIQVTSLDLDLGHVSTQAMSYVLLYNLALAYHLRASVSQCKNLRAGCLRKSLTLYEHAYQVLLKAGSQFPILHAMAIISNLGQINRVTGNLTKADQCYQNLLSTLLVIVDSGEREEIIYFDDFLSIVMPMIARSSSAPAA